tara:strand:- start:721 stop:1191 length:471 start_codon:yes stop_codon:yes gene_type:complete
MTTKTKDMIIQVYGLHRSGTNYIEYLIRNNIKNNNYERKEAYNEFTGQLDSLKHCYPDINAAKYHICIFKPLNQWLLSHEKYTPKKINNPVQTYVEWESIFKGFAYKNPNVVLIDYNEFIGKELYYFRSWGWDIEFNDVFKIPIKRMGKESGRDFE